MTTINDIQDLHRILIEHPEWRDELRKIILTQELLDVPSRLDELTATVQALADTSAALLEHAEATNRRLDSMESRMEGMESRMESMDSRMDNLNTTVQNLKISVDRLRGDGLEDRLPNLIPPLVSREFDVRRIYPMWASRTLASNDRREEFERILEEASDEGRITDDDETRLRVTDLIARAQRKSDRSTLWFAVEASGVISDEDVTRVVRSVNAINKVYAQDAIPIVYGYEISDENRALASEHDVRVYLSPDRR